MKLLINSICIILSYSYEHINGIIPNNKPYYISSKISDIHKEWITDAVDIISPYKQLKIQEYYDSNCIRIYYSDLRYTGFSDFEGYLMSNNEWLIDTISIGINPNIQFYNSFVLIMIHELLHTFGIHHSDVLGSIMNISIYVLDGIVKDVPFPILHQDDIEAINALN